MGTGLSRQGRLSDQKDAQEIARRVPTTGMRGGLGRTLLTAFLILTVVPLAVIGVYAVTQSRSAIEEEVGARLLAIATLKGESIADQLQELQAMSLRVRTSLTAGAGDATAAFADGPDGSGSTSVNETWWEILHRQVSGVVGGAVFDMDGQSVWSVGGCDQIVSRALVRRAPDATGDALSRAVFLPSAGGDPAATVLIQPEGETLSALCLQTEVMVQMLQAEGEVGEAGEIRFVVWDHGQSGNVAWPSGEPVVLPSRHTITGRSTEPEGGDTLSLASADSPGYALYQNQRGDWVIGGYYPLPALAGGVLVEQRQDEVFASTERIMATLIALILAVALVTTAIAAVVIRQITRPVIDLTESGVAMAEGNLDQHLAVRSRDEIGILTFVFNEMATELKSLYRDLEAKVVERTKRLQQANYQIQRRALHLQASQEVSQAITSIRDPELLLTRVTDLIRNHFIYSSVAVYLVAPGGGEARLQASSPRVQEARSEGVERTDDTASGDWPMCCWPGDGSVVGRAIRKGATQLMNERADEAREGGAEAGKNHQGLGWYSRYLSRVAIPLKMADRTVGAVAVMTTAHEGIQHDELEVLEGLANQVTIALENARAYERERLAMEQMEATEAFKAYFLGNMSRELREPLNTVIGFSRLLIKGIDGPLNARQLEDLEQIHNDSQHLLFLINDILSISQIQAGLMALRQQPVDLAGLLNGVMPTASALVRGRDIALRQELPEDLPNLYADPNRLRQVLVHLLNNAAKFTEAGEIVIRAWSSEDEVYVSISDTGIGIPLEDRERIFAHFEKGCSHEHDGQGGIGLGLALCREYVELHGGRIWVDSDVGVGSTFTFSVPAYVPDAPDVPELAATCGLEVA